MYRHFWNPLSWVTSYFVFPLPISTTSYMYYHQQNKCYPKGIYVPISKLHSILAKTNLLIHNKICQICHRILQFNSSFLTPFGETFILLATQRGFMGTIAYDYSRSIAEQIRSIAENRRRSTEAYRRVMSTWPSMMVGTAEGDLPKLFSPALLA